MTGKELKALRESLGLSRRQVAIIFGISESAVKHTENDIRWNEIYVSGIASLHAGLTYKDSRVTTGKFRAWRKRNDYPVALLQRAIRAAISRERYRCKKLVEYELKNYGQSSDSIVRAIENGVRLPYAGKAFIDKK